MTIVWQKWRDEWHIMGSYIDAGEARAVAAGIRDPGCECCDPRDVKSFEVEAIGRLCGLSASEFDALTPGVHHGPMSGRIMRSMLRLGWNEVVVTRRISKHLVEVYNDRTISYEVIGRRTP